MSAEATRRARTDPDELGWDCPPGTYLELLPREAPRTRLGLRRGPHSSSWLRPSTLLASRNDIVARLLGDPAEDERAAWMRQPLADGRTPAPYIARPAAREVSFLVVGDSGEGDASQYATVPLIRGQADTAFMVICSDVIYPAGDVNQYLEKFYFPYRDYPAPIYAVPGNHDWYDGLNGFMQHLCGARPLEVRPRGLRRRVRHALWRRPSIADPVAVAAGRALRDRPGQHQTDQTSSYWAMDAGPVRLVGIDTGIAGRLDAEQARWLLDVSAATDRPKVLITGKPLMVDAGLRPCPLAEPVTGADGVAYTTVDEVVGAPAHRYVAAIGGDIHNYQHYVATRAGRPFHYVVSGGGGAFLHATHKIGPLDPAELHGADEDRFVCYPLRGDSLSAYSLLLSRALGAGTRLRIPRGDASAILAAELGIEPTTAAGAAALARGVPQRSRVRAQFVRHVGGRVVQRFFSEILDWNTPPMFRHVLRLDAAPGALRVRALAATGCRRHELEPPVVDDFTIAL